jgi:hypothetical protein
MPEVAPVTKAVPGPVEDVLTAALMVLSFE